MMGIAMTITADNFPRRGQYVETEHHGLPCVVRTTDFGHKCGYIGLPESHPLFGKHYDDVPDVVDAFGGFTFSEPGAGGLWWIGWDDAHYEKFSGDHMQECARLAELLMGPLD